MSLKLSVQSNPTGWGPAELPEKPTTLPYNPVNLLSLTQSVQAQQQTQQQQQQATQPQLFLKSDFKLGRYAELSTAPTTTQTQQRRKAKEDEEEDQNEFSTVRYKQRAAKRATYPNQSRGRQRNTKGRWNSYGGRGRYRRNYSYRPAVRLHKPSVEPKASWPIFNKFIYQDLNKLAVEKIPVGEDIMKCGTLCHYDIRYDKITTKSPVQVSKNVTNLRFPATTSDDPILKEMITKATTEQPSLDEDELEPITVYATDTLLALLMTAMRSVYSWDLVITKNGSVIVIDKRQNSNIELWTVNENSSYIPLGADEQSDRININSAPELAIEATVVNLNFANQVIEKRKKFEFDNPNPFSDHDLSGYRYRKWKVDDNLTVIARCTIDAIDFDKKEYVVAKALNEYETKYSGDWKPNLDKSRGNIVINELRANSSKLARWTAQAFLAGAHQFKLGFISRTDNNNNANHVVVGTESFAPITFASQMDLKPSNMWAVLRTIANAVAKLEDGKYILLKEPNKPSLQLYGVPAFEEEEEEQNEEEEEKKEEEEDQEEDQADFADEDF